MFEARLAQGKLLKQASCNIPSAATGPLQSTLRMILAALLDHFKLTILLT